MDLVDRVHALAWHPRRPVLAFGGRAERLVLYDFAAGVAGSQDVAEKSMQMLSWHPGGEWLALGDEEGALHKVRVRGREIESTWQDAGYEPRCDGVAVSPDGRLMAATSLNSGVRLYDVSARQPRQVNADADPSRSYCVAWSPDSQHLACGTWNHKVHIWTRDLQPVATIDEATPGEIRDLVFDATGRRLLVGGGTGSNNAVVCWDLTGREIARTAIAGLVQGVARDPQSGQIAAAAWDNKVHLLSPDAGRLLSTLEGHSQKVWAVDFDATGQWLASAGDDGDIRLWNAQTGELLHILSLSTDRVVLPFAAPAEDLVLTLEEKHRRRLAQGL